MGKCVKVYKFGHSLMIFPDLGWPLAATAAFFLSSFLFSCIFAIQIIL